MNKPSLIGYINEQGEVLRYTFGQRSLYCNPLIEVFKKSQIKKIYLIGSGTSYNASIAIKTYFEKFLPVEVEVVIPTIFTNYVTINNNQLYAKENILVIGISQSGTSYSTVNAMKKAKSEGYTTIALTENEESLITKEVDQVLKLCVGKELIPVETKGYTTTLLTGYCWALELAYALQKMNEEDYQTRIQKIDKMLNNFEKYLDEVNEWYERNSEELIEMEHGHVAAYGSNTCTAIEAELKIYETFKRPIHAYELEELIHGPQMAFNNRTYVYIVASAEKEIERISLFQNWFKENEVTEHLFIITTEDIALSEKDLKFKTEVFDELSQLVFTLPFQIIAAKNSERVGYDTSVRPLRRKAFAHEYKE
ncbi:SIS domain-containing protein [Anaerorhabdus sp.]|uniref:SIS domain-containing protein n=1 Tax=Anaerorhabdus sp. TaxID=1872524 RepID=UPI002B1EA738|nr:SIS domain-containing protein [Anaerorhabdus sp.]MEA4874921.1 SIS domain-containing protein [Anaerorhabdus sp.]